MYFYRRDSQKPCIPAMKKQSFIRKTDESLVLVNCKVHSHNLALALDTGASHTTIDLTALIIAGYDLSKSHGTVNFETASGIIEGYRFFVKHFSAIGIVKTNMEICAYDFFAHHVLTDFDGMLGLDFFDDKEVCINFKKLEITIK